jgi:hypothetical protein
LSKGAIIGIAVGVPIGSLLILGLGAFFIIKRVKRRREAKVKTEGVADT